jgi:nucleotide-binding universal stress UspA family protein
MYDSILVPTDGSSGTTEPLDHAVSIARDNSAVVHGLYVVDRQRYRAAEGDAKAEIKKSLELEGERALEELRTDLEDSGIPVKTERRDGIPHREIADYVADNGIDLVVMGTHGRTGRDRIANLGSVTQRVVRGTDVPVLVVDIGG